MLVTELCHADSFSTIFLMKPLIKYLCCNPLISYFTLGNVPLGCSLNIMIFFSGKKYFFMKNLLHLVSCLDNALVDLNTSFQQRR